MEIKEKISVVIVNFNAGGGLVDSVRTVIAVVYEVIVIDNASSDGSLELLESAFGSDSKLRIVRGLSNEGFAKACNRGVALATGEFVFFLNPDCELEEGAMACLLEAIQTDAEVGMVGGLLLNPDGSEQAGGRRAIPTPWRSFVRAFGLARFSKRWPKLFFDFHLHKEPLPNSPIEVEAISGACMLVKRDAMQEIGLLDEEYFMHCEDLDWCIRFRRGEWKIIFVPGARPAQGRQVTVRVAARNTTPSTPSTSNAHSHDYAPCLLVLRGSDLYLREQSNEILGLCHLHAKAYFLGLRLQLQCVRTGPTAKPLCTFGSARSQ